MKLDEARHWIDIADKDLLGARRQIQYGEDAILEHVGFFCQQAIEKYLKAFLIAYDKDFPRTHNLEYLARLCRTVDSEFGEWEFGKLTAFAVEQRYPEFETQVTVTLDEVRSYLRLSESSGKRSNASWGLASRTRSWRYDIREEVG